MRLFYILLLSIYLSKIQGIHAGEFVGSVELKYGDSLSQSHKIKLLKPLEYRDSDGSTWTALEGTTVETEFLTHELLSHKGFPHPTEYLKSHVIYSAQAEQASGNWKDAQKMLHSALLDEGTPYISPGPFMQSMRHLDGDGKQKRGQRATTIVTSPHRPSNGNLW